jgi:hypothetical protein
LPADYDTNFLYHIPASCLTPKLKCQYIGVTVAGRRMLVMNEIYNEEFCDAERIARDGFGKWQHEWIYICDAGCQVFYDLATGKIWEIDT